MKLRSTSITVLCGLVASASVTTYTKHVKLTSTAIALIDGSFVRWQEFALMITVRTEILSILHGPLKDGKRVGQYQFNDTLYTLDQLADLEEQYKQNSDKTKLKQLRPIIKQVRSALQANLNRYIALARGAKGPMLILIDESCKKHGRHRSILHNWGAIKDGQEEQQMEKDLISLTICRQFCLDLLNFLEDMMYSCEKARKQFDKEMERRRRNSR